MLLKWRQNREQSKYGFDVLGMSSGEGDKSQRFERCAHVGVNHVAKLISQPGFKLCRFPLQFDARDL